VSFLRSILLVRKGERAKTAGMFLYFFIVVSAYWFLKPLRSVLTIEQLGADAIRELKIINAFVSAVVVAAYSLALARFSREKLTYLVLGAFVWALLFFWFFLGHYGAVKTVYYCFYVFIDLFMTVNTALFWTFLADIVDPESAPRLYGLVGAGGVLGGVAGSYGNTLASGVAPENMLLIVAAAYLLLFAIVFGVSRRLHRLPHVARGIIATPGESKLADALKGARQVFASPYFLGICLVLASYEFISTVNDFCLHKAVDIQFRSGGSIDSLRSFFSRFFLAVNLVALVVQTFVTSLVVRRVGVTAGLLVLPVIIVGLSVGFLAVPCFALAELLFLSDNSLNYSINQTTRELLFVPVSREERYRVLAFIDMLVLRSAKAAGGFLLLLLPVLAASGSVEGLRWCMVVTVPLGLVTIVTSVYLGRRHGAVLARGKHAP